ncbi:MAG TPA: HdeD family acid-resistance protein [Methylothermaceae bacterium]|nr:HdeD family acid-resistance protein [Methylothermaceae bacterium]
MNAQVPLNIQELPQSWRTMLALGILMVILGIIGMGMSFALTITTVVFFGAFLLVSGCMQLAHALFGKEVQQWQGKAMHTIVAILYIFGGLITIFNPIAASFALTAVLAGVFLGLGVYRIYVALERRRQNQPWGTLVAVGVADMLIAAIIMMGMPWSALWVLGLLIAVELVMNGAMLIATALEKRKQEQQTQGA